MAVKINKISTTVTLLLFFSFSLVLNTSCASESSMTSKVVERSKMKYQKALDAFNKQLEYCSNKTSNTKLEPSLLNDIKLTQPQLKIAVYWYYKQAQAKCENEKYGLFLIQRGLYREVLKQYSIKLDDENPPYYDNHELFGGRYKDVELELEFLSYPKKERDKLDKIQELKEPFMLTYILKEK